MKTIDLTPKASPLIAEQEMIKTDTSNLAENIGGLKFFSNGFKRGYGNKVFGSGEQGIWLGAADFEDAPFSVDMQGQSLMKNATFKDENDTTFIDAKGLKSSAVFNYGNKNGSPGTSFTNTTYADESGASLSFNTVGTNTRIFFSLSVQSASGHVDINYNMSGRTFYRMMLDSTPSSTEILYDSYRDLSIAVRQENVIRKSYALSGVFTIANPGTHTIKLQRMISEASVNMLSALYSYDFTYIILGS